MRAYQVLEIVSVPYFVVYAGVSVRAIVRRDTLRAERTAQWTSRWGTDAVNAFQRAADGIVWAILAYCIGYVLLLLGTPIGGSLPAIGMICGGVGIAVLVVAQGARFRALKMAVAYQHLPANSAWALTKSATRDPAAFDNWVAGYRSRGGPRKRETHYLRTWGRAITRIVLALVIIFCVWSIVYAAVAAVRGDWQDASTNLGVTTVVVLVLVGIERTRAALGHRGSNRST